ncbi:MAG: class I SAM-dependent methyltransferase [Actinobacteria bacterium]|nr:class I SAM-dependent methyltransferase [Actinomycetota bacterium]
MRQNAGMGSWSPEVGAAHAVIPSLFEVYDAELVPLVFEGYVDDLVARTVAVAPDAVLEVAAGTGVVTRGLAAALPADVPITATDLVAGMLERAQAVGTARPVTWEVADALDLPYADASFDAVVCGFGAMFFSPHDVAFAQARRVLRPGGTYLCTVWDCIDRNELCAAVADAVAEIFPDDPPEFLTRTPYGYFEPDVIAADLAAAGFTARPEIERVERRARAASPEDVARAVCAGTPLRDEIVRRGDDALAHAIRETARRLEDRFGSADVEGRTAALVVTVRA